MIQYGVFNPRYSASACDCGGNDWDGGAFWLPLPHLPSCPWVRAGVAWALLFPSRVWVPPAFPAVPSGASGFCGGGRACFPEEFNLKVLASLPIDPKIREHVDNGDIYNFPCYELEELVKEII